MEFVKDGNTYEPEQLLSGTGHQTLAFEIPEGKKFKRGDVLDKEGNIIKKDNVADVYGIASEDIDGERETALYVSGEFVFESLGFDGEVKFETEVVEAFRNKSMYIKKLGGN